jgi:hypothetical protein
MEKKIANFDHDDADTLCKKRQEKYVDCCWCCPLKIEGECKAYLFRERDRLNSIIKETFGNEAVDNEGRII